jgi:hypothetical protein
MIVPLPPHCEHGWEIENRPCPSASTPRPWHLGQISGAVPGLAPVPRRDGERDLRALDRLLEGDADLGLQVATLLGAFASPSGAAAGRGPAAEQVGEDVAEAAGERPRIEAAEAARPAAGRERARAAVVLLALLGIGQDVVRLGDLLEALLRLLVPLVRVGVVLPRELAVALLDLIRRRVLGDAQGLVVVGPPSHGYSATTTRAGRRTTPFWR